MTRPSADAPSRLFNIRFASWNLSVFVDSRRTIPSASRYLIQKMALSLTVPSETLYFGRYQLPIVIHPFCGWDAADHGRAGHRQDAVPGDAGPRRGDRIPDTRGGDRTVPGA